MKATIYTLLTALVVIQGGTTTALDSSALSLCQKHPQFDENCISLKNVNDGVEKMLARAATTHGYTSLEEVHSGCQTMEYRDIFGICKQFKNLAQEYYSHLDGVHRSIIALAQPSVGKQVDQNAYSGCMTGSLDDNFCQKLGDFSTQLAQEDNPELLLTPGINDVCADRPTLLICSKMRQLAALSPPLVKVRSRQLNP